MKNDESKFTSPEFIFRIVMCAIIFGCLMWIVYLSCEIGDKAGDLIGKVIEGPVNDLGEAAEELNDELEKLENERE